MVNSGLGQRLYFFDYADDHIFRCPHALFSTDYCRIFGLQIIP
jgi:hypothetical protein